MPDEAILADPQWFKFDNDKFSPNDKSKRRD